MEQRSVLGARIGKALEMAGLTTEQAGKSLHIARTTIDRWITGEVEPGAVKLGRLASLVNKPVDWFFQENDDVEAGQEVAATLVRIFGDMMSGRTPDEAYDRETGNPLWLNPTVREFLRSQAHRMRAAIERSAGRPWDAIDGAEKQRVLQEFVRMVLPEEDLGLRRGESGDELRSPWPLPEAEMPGR